MAQVVDQKLSSLLLKALFSFIVPLVLYFILPIDGKGLTHHMAMFLVVTVWIVIVWALDLVNEIATSLLLPVLYIVFCAVPANVVYNNWLSDIPNIVIGGFVLCKILQTSGLGKRLGLGCMKAMGGSFVGVLWGITFAIYVVSPVIPTVAGKAVIFSAIVVSLCESLDFKKGSREATALMLVTFLAVASSKNCFLTGGGDLVMGMNLVDKVLGTKTGWLEYASWSLLPATIYTIMGCAIVIILLPSKVNVQELKAVLEVRYAELGAMTTAEKKAAFLLGLTLVFLITDKFHGLTPGMVLIFISFLTFVPKMDLMNAEKLKTVNFSPLFFILGCMAIGSAGNYLKVTNWMADNTFGYLEGLSVYSASIAAYIIGVAGNFILTPLAATASFSSPLAELALQIGLEPKILYFAFTYGFDNYLLPYEYAVLLLCYSFGYIHFGSMVKVLAARIVLTGVFLFAIAVPYWEWVMK